jgi:predicted component of type VI protein secretion system
MNVSLVLLKANGSHKAFDLPSSVTVLGRRHDCDLRIPLPTVSRRHCEISQNGESVDIRDLDSKGGTFVNDQRVNGETSVKAGDYIRIGPLTFMCRVDGQPEEVAPPQKKPEEKPKSQEAAAGPADDLLEDSFADLDASDSFIELDESDSELEDL